MERRQDPQRDTQQGDGVTQQAELDRRAQAFFDHFSRRPFIEIRAPEIQPRGVGQPVQVLHAKRFAQPEPLP